MDPYDRHYDYGLRGYPTGARSYRRDARRYGADFVARNRHYDYGYRGAPGTRTPRVTAGYNRDYVFPHPEDRTVNYNAYGGGPGIEVSGRDAYRSPYDTIGGSHTSRGARPVFWERASMRYGGDFY